jgi:hypothetical protein
MELTPLQRLAALALDEDPALWAARQRRDRWTWQQIADQLSEKVEIPVSRETVRLWAVPHLEAEAVAE